MRRYHLYGHAPYTYTIITVTNDGKYEETIKILKEDGEILMKTIEVDIWDNMMDYVDENTAALLSAIPPKYVEVIENRIASKIAEFWWEETILPLYRHKDDGYDEEE